VAGAVRRLHHQHPAVPGRPGLCAKGEAGASSERRHRPGGRLPVNTNGGGLSCVHPGMYGIFALIEAVRQLRGDCGERQVPGLSTALAHGNGGTLSSQATAILGPEIRYEIRHAAVGPIWHRNLPWEGHDPRRRNLNALLDTVNRFVRERLVPVEAQVAETDEIPSDIVRDMKAMGLFGLTDPRGIRRPGPDDGGRGAGDAGHGPDLAGLPLALRHHGGHRLAGHSVRRHARAEGRSTCRGWPPAK
jgi:hypothetical protein